MTAFDIKPITTRTREAAFRLATEVFARSSSVHAALNVDLETYRTFLQPFFNTMVSQNLSLAAFDRSQNMLGCLIATDMFDTTEDAAPSGPYPQIGALTQALSQRYQRHRTVNAKDVVLVDMAAVHPDATGMGVYKALRAHLERAARNAGWRYVVGELSSVATQHVVLQTMGHRNVAEISFEDFTWNDEKPFRHVTSPRSIILAEGTL
ncbi:MAG: hypothetical protein AAGH17_06660 [Pseudomonadota bacterium]